MSNFVHLHCHTEYSLLDGAIRLKDLCAKAQACGMPAAAITDHGNLFGALHFYKTAKAAGVKPIIGCEVYVAHNHHQDRESPHARMRYHLILLAQNNIGYSNLMQLVTLGYTQGMYYKPRVDKALLKQYNQGIIALSACLAGEIPRIIMAGQSSNASLGHDINKKSSEEYGDGSLSDGGFDAAIRMAQEYASIFPDRFYLELQHNGLPEQNIVNRELIKLAEQTKLPLVATNDCHYLNKEDAEAHEVLLCIQTQTTMADPKRMRFETQELYYKTPEEMTQDFAHLPQALENTLLIADQCKLDLQFNNYRFPLYNLSDCTITQQDAQQNTEDAAEIPDNDAELPPNEQLRNKQLRMEFRHLCRQGLAKRLEKLTPDTDTKPYTDRLEVELSIICKMGFAAYFLIVQDFINWAKQNTIPVGPGRGSAAGSIVAWALKITNIDPLPYNLLFERFLNIERISMPDIDIDFCERRRAEVIRYVTEKYGSDSVAQITTFGKMKTKGVVRDVGRALGMSFQETDRIVKLIPDDLKMTLRKALDIEPQLRSLYEDDPVTRQVLTTCLSLEGLNRHASTHAAGVVISDRPMVEYLPLYKGKRDETVTQFDMKNVEEVGLIKFDFLGLRTMTLVQDTLDSITAQGKIAPDLDTLPLDDKASYELYSRGDTDGIFQVESSGMRKYLQMLRPNTFEDIIAMLALYRPGPLGSGMVDEFIKRKHGELPVSFPLESLENCLKETHGVIVYQEQVMQIAQIAAGYTLGEADLLRRAMGKKDPAEMAKQRDIFLAGAQKNHVPAAKAKEIFDLMEKFAEYGFNKSHSAAYALVSYYTAYLKVHYKKEFMAALLTTEMGNQDKLLKYVAACKDMDIPVHQPNVQLSRWEFSVHNDSIVFGLGGIKNVGEEAIKELILARGDSPFSSLLDFCSRVNLRRISKRVLENLIKGGACDCFGMPRSALLAAVELTVTRAQKIQKNKESNQTSLFSMIPEEDMAPASPGIGFDCPEQNIMEWPNEELLRYEKEALGFYLSSHPLQPYRKEINRLALSTLEDCRELPVGSVVSTGILITSYREHVSKQGRRMAFCQIEDLTGSAECAIFPKAYEACAPFLQSDTPLLLEARVEVEDNSFNNNSDDTEEEVVVRNIKLIAETLSFLKDACQQSSAPLELCLPAEKLTLQQIDRLKNVLAKHKGATPVELRLNISSKTDGNGKKKWYWCRIALPPSYSILSSPEFDAAFKDWEKQV